MRGEKTPSSPTPLFLCSPRKRRQVHREIVQNGQTGHILEDYRKRAHLKRIYSFIFFY
jgi:hypothetical protein